MSKRPIEDVLVVGAGPVGLTLACELARRGIRAQVIDKLPTLSPYCRAIGVTPRTLEVWDDMGIARDMIDAGVWIKGRRMIVNGRVSDNHLDLSDLPYSMLGLPQYETERILARHLCSFGVTIERGVTFDGLTQSKGLVQATLIDSAGERREREYSYVVGCDGAHSSVRRALGIGFEGSAIPAEFILGDVRVDWTLPRGMALFAIRPAVDAAPDMFIAIPLPEPRRYRVSTIAPVNPAAAPAGTDHGVQSERPSPGLEPLQAAADRLLPEKARLSDLRWGSIFRISIRLAERYREGNVFIAGDAAHIHPPTGGQGMNTGIQDAYNLAWKLMLVMKGFSSDSLLDSYEAERRPVAQEVLARTTEATMQLSREGKEAGRLADTQILVNYRTSPWVANSPNRAKSSVGPHAGDRMPDCQGLHRQGIGFPIHLLDTLRGPEHLLVAYGQDSLTELPAVLNTLRGAGLLRVQAILKQGSLAVDQPGWPCYVDAAGQFAETFGPEPTFLLIRPDKYLVWHGPSLDDAGLNTLLAKTFDPD